MIRWRRICALAPSILLTSKDGDREAARADRTAKLAGHIYGDWQQPVNQWQNVPNSIHNDAIAATVGMRGGTIPGSSHLRHFRPILDDLFGPRWLTQFAISMFYTFATVDREEVRAVVKAPPAGASGWANATPANATRNIRKTTHRTKNARA